MSYSDKKYEPKAFSTQMSKTGEICFQHGRNCNLEEATGTITATLILNGI